MKKWLLFLIPLYVVLIIYVFVFVEDPPRQIDLLAIKQSRSLLMGPDESYVVDVYSTAEESFLTDKEEVYSIHLWSEDSVLEVSLKDIVSETECVVREGINLYRFHFIFDFNEVYVPGARLEFPDCNLAIVYQNQTEIELEIGDLVIWFRQPSEIVHLDFTRLYGINNVYMDRNYLGAIVMDISSLAMDDVTIKTVDIGALNVFTNKNSGIQLDHYPDYDESLSLLLNEPEYRPDEYFSIDTNVLAIDTSGIFLFPLAYSEYPLVVDRLFISITYTYLDIDYEFVIDDFIFYTTNSLEVVSNEEISRYSYSY